MVKEAVSSEAQTVQYNIRKLKMEYKEALKTNKGWDTVYNSASAFFKELTTMERSLLGNDKEFLRNLDTMITIYQEAKERSTAERFDGEMDR